MTPKDPKNNDSLLNHETEAEERNADPIVDPPIDELDTEELEPAENPYRETDEPGRDGEKSALLIDEEAASDDDDDEVSPFDVEAEPVRKGSTSESARRQEESVLETETEGAEPAVFRLEDAAPDENEASSLLLDDFGEDDSESTGAPDKPAKDKEVPPLDLEDETREETNAEEDEDKTLPPAEEGFPRGDIPERAAISASADEEDDSLPSLLLIDEQEYAAAPSEDAEQPALPDVDLRLVSIDDEEDADETPARGTDTADEDVESSLLLEGDEDESLPEPEETSAPPRPRSKDDTDRSRLLADIGDLEDSTTEATPPPSDLDTDPGLEAGGSSLLLDSATSVSGSTPATPAPAESRKRRRRKSERVKVAPPKLDQKIEWFANPVACAEYCRKHKRPLLLYFTPGDMDRSESYEEAIRMSEVQPFLSPYVCCIVDTRQPSGREVALRMGLPPDEPAMVILSPRGHEFARVRKPVVDWQFIATMLFWALR